MKSLTYKIYPPIGKPFCLTNYNGYTVRVDTGSRQKESRLHFIRTMMKLGRGKYKIDIERLG